MAKRFVYQGKKAKGANSMNTHDYLILSAALERYNALLNIAAEERRLRAIGNHTPHSPALWHWVRHWFEQRAPTFAPLTKT